MKHLLTILLLIFTACLYAQKQGQERIDSLKTVHSQVQTDTIQVKLLNDIAWEYLWLSKFDTAMIYSEKALKIIEKINYTRGASDAYNTLGTIYRFRGDFPNSVKYYNLVLDIRREIGDQEGLAKILANLGVLYKDQKKFPEALNHFFSALKIFEEFGFKLGISFIYIEIGNVYVWLSNYEKALEYYLKAEKINTEAGDKQDLAKAYNGIGNVYKNQKNYNTALEYHFKALKIVEDAGNKYNIIAGFINIGLIYESMENFKSASEYYHRSLVLAKEIASDKLIVDAEYQLGMLETKLKRFDKAERWFKSSLNRSSETKNTNRLMDNHSGLSDVYKYKGDYKNALRHYELFRIYKDSVFNEENTIKLTQAEMNYVFEKQQDSIRMVNEAEIAVRDATLQANRRQRWFFIGALVALGVIGALMYYQSRQRKKNNKLLRNLNTELSEANRIKTRFFSILNHDLRGPVSNLIHFLHLKKENPELLDEETKQRLEQKSIQGAENLLVTMEDLLLWSKGQMENFKPKPEKVNVHQLFEDTKKVFSGYQNIQFEYHNPDAVEIFTDENYLKTIIRNLTSNAINVFIVTPKPKIVWNASHENGKIILSITDNGPGADSEKFRALYDDKEVVGIKSGLGLHLIRDLAKAIDCTIVVKSDIGKETSIILKFDK